MGPFGHARMERGKWRRRGVHTHESGRRTITRQCRHEGEGNLLCGEDRRRDARGLLRSTCTSTRHAPSLDRSKKWRDLVPGGGAEAVAARETAHFLKDAVARWGKFSPPRRRSASPFPNCGAAGFALLSILSILCSAL